MRDTQEGSDLFDDSGGAAAAGRFLYGVCGGARVLAGDEDAVSGDCGRSNAGGRNFSQFNDCGDSEVLSRACAENHERDLVAGAGDVHESDRGGGPRRGCAQLQRSGMEGAVRAGPGARCAVYLWAGGHIGPCVAAAGFWFEDGN